MSPGRIRFYKRRGGRKIFPLPPCGGAGERSETWGVFSTPLFCADTHSHAEDVAWKSPPTDSASAPDGALPNRAPPQGGSKNGGRIDELTVSGGGRLCVGPDKSIKDQDSFFVALSHDSVSNFTLIADLLDNKSANF